MTSPNAERLRLQEQHLVKQNWRRWGLYLGERQWGTVREDYSAHGAAWDYFSHDQARSRAYRWGEDGIAGFSDDKQILCLALALWNERDPMLKERLFGLTNGEGNHGEDVKELYYYLDATPTHSYLKMLYKYPQEAFSYDSLTEENRRRGSDQLEFELLDMDVFDDNRYFDVFVEYAKVGPDDILMRVMAHNRGAEAVPLHLLPQSWFRNTWSWDHDTYKPALAATGDDVVKVRHRNWGDFQFYADGAPPLLFCDNETNSRCLYGMASAGYFKDAFHDAIVQGDQQAVNPWRVGTKATAHYRFSVPPGEAVQVRLRLSKDTVTQPFADFDQVFTTRRGEADAFYAQLQAEIAAEDARLVQRQPWRG